MAKLYFRKKGNTRRTGITVDADVYEEYKNTPLYLIEGEVAFHMYGKSRYLHREILELKDPYTKVYTKNGNKLDLRRENLDPREIHMEARGTYSVQLPKSTRNEFPSILKYNTQPQYFTTC